MIAELFRRIETLEPICFSAFSEAVRRADAFARTPLGGGDIALVIGPSGCGKTTLFKVLTTSIFGPKEAWAPYTRPIIATCLRNTQGGYFNSKWLIRRLLTEMQDPFRSDLHAKVSWDLPIADRNKLLLATTSKANDREATMQDAFVGIAKAFALKLMMLDEANMMCLTQRNRSPTDYLEALRCIAQEVGCAVILFGTVDLLQMLNYSAQMNRREFVIEMKRIDSPDDEWHTFLSQLERDLGIAPLLSSNMATLHETTYGIPGEVVSRVRQAAIAAHAQQDSRLSWSHFEATAPLYSVVRRMREEATQIELAIWRYKAGELPTKQPRPLKTSPSPPDRKAKKPGVRRARRWPVTT